MTFERRRLCLSKFLSVPLGHKDERTHKSTVQSNQSTKKINYHFNVLI